jgi:uncharacterized protein
MEYTWNDAKRTRNLRKHGLDFAHAQQVFEGPTLTHEDTRLAYGERRFNTTGLLGTIVVVITHTETTDTIRLISMRKAETYESEEFFSYL